MSRLRAGSAGVRVALGLLLIVVMAPVGVAGLKAGNHVHIVLATVEIVGAILLMLPRTVVAGAATLLLCIAFALVVHRAASPVPLLYLALLLVACVLLDRAVRARTAA